MRRYLIVFGALLIQLCLGTIYAWSAFTQALTATDGPFAFTATQSQMVFSVGLVVFAAAMVMAGRWQASIGPRRVAMMGGALLGAGYLLASVLGTTFAGQLLCIGVIGGAGIGLAYVCPIAVGIRWFPERKGLITGIAVAGFGFGALIWVKLAGPWAHLIENHGVLGTFRIYGLIYLVAVLIGSIWMVYPESSAAAQAQAARAGMTPAEMLRTPQFYIIWITFIVSAMGGLMVIGIIKLFGIDALTAAGVESAGASAIAGTAMAVYYAIFNGIGRIAWGSLSDPLGRKRSIILMCAIQGVAMLAFFHLGRAESTFYFAAALVGFNFGGNFALFPAITADYFGSATVGRNYGWVFTAYGVGGILGPVMAGTFKDVGAHRGVDAWLPAFIVAGVGLLLVAFLMTRLKPIAPRVEASVPPTVQPELAGASR